MQVGIADSLVDQMRGRFEANLKLATELKSPNPEDTLDLRCAIVGFSYHAETEEWSYEEYEFVSSWLALDPDMWSDSQRQLASMCLGGLCALKTVGRLTDTEFQLAEAQLPGLLLAIGSFPQC